jgi:hypothetical protein
VPILIYGGKQDPLHWNVQDAHALQREMGFFDFIGTTNPRVKFIIINKCVTSRTASTRSSSTPI